MNRKSDSSAKNKDSTLIYKFEYIEVRWNFLKFSEFSEKFCGKLRKKLTIFKILHKSYVLRWRNY